MYDIDLKNSLHRKFLCPHLAVVTDWNSFAMVCNPNATSSRVNLSYYDVSGRLVDTIAAPRIPANGSANYSIAGLFQRSMAGGTLIIEADNPVTAFLLYASRTTTWRAGLSAIPLN